MKHRLAREESSTARSHTRPKAEGSAHFYSLVTRVANWTSPTTARCSHRAGLQLRDPGRGTCFRPPGAGMNHPASRRNTASPVCRAAGRARSSSGTPRPRPARGSSAIPSRGTQHTRAIAVITPKYSSTSGAITVAARTGTRVASETRCAGACGTAGSTDRGNKTRRAATLAGRTKWAVRASRQRSTSSRWGDGGWRARRGVELILRRLIPKSSRPVAPALREQNRPFPADFDLNGIGFVEECSPVDSLPGFTGHLPAPGREFLGGQAPRLTHPSNPPTSRWARRSRSSRRLSLHSRSRWRGTA